MTTSYCPPVAGFATIVAFSSETFLSLRDAHPTKRNAIATIDMIDLTLSPLRFVSYLDCSLFPVAILLIVTSLFCDESDEPK